MYLRDMLQLRVQDYRSKATHLLTAIDLAWEPLLNGKRRTKTLQLRLKFKSVRHTTMHVLEQLEELPGILQPSNFYAGRNALFADIRVGAHQWKHNFHIIMDSAHASWSIALGLATSEAVSREWKQRLLRHFTRSAGEINEAKAMMKELRGLIARRTQCTQYSMESVVQFSHAYFRANQGVYKAIERLRSVYFNACRQGIDWTLSEVRFESLASRYTNSGILNEVQILIQALHFLQATRTSQKYNYQIWPSTTPAPVMPSFVAEAVEKHRSRYGSSSIF